jgi:hypothetical protein
MVNLLTEKLMTVDYHFFWKFLRASSIALSFEASVP